MRPEHEHLTEAEIERLLEGGPDEAGARRHAASCGLCRALLELHEQAARQLEGLRPEIVPETGAECPPQREWPMVASGMIGEETAQNRLEHAMECDACGSLLKDAAEFGAGEPTAEEELALARLVTSTERWRRSFGGSLQRVSSRRLRWEAAAMAAGVVLAAAGWWWMGQRLVGGEEGAVNRLLAQAYQQDRRVEMRLRGAGYGPMRVVRGSGETESAMDRPPALLEAEARIGKALRSSRDEARWLEVQARADLIEGRRYQAAITELERAQAERPGDQAVRTDLATAYFERGDALNRPLDYAKAVELLGAVIHDQPQDKVALFNRAIALERAELYHQAEADWKRYLELDGTTDWAAEARRRLTALQEKIGREKRRVGQALESPGAFAAAVGRGRPEELGALDARVEDYIEEARGGWIRSAFGVRGASEARRGLEALAWMMAARHGDVWLKDFLKAGQREPGFAAAALTLGQGAAAARAGDYDAARRMAHEAGQRLRALGNRAGVIEAGWQELYATRLAARTRECDAMARAETAALRRTGYLWLRGRALLDAGFCAKMVNDKRAAEQDGQESAQTAENSGYRALQLAAVKFSADLALADGESAAVFRRAGRVLAEFWDPGAQELLGYNACTTLVGAGEYEGMWRFSVAAAREALALFPRGRDPFWRTAVEEELARDLMLAGDLSEARERLLAARRMVAAAPANETARLRSAEVEEWLGQAELTSGRPVEAMKWLDEVGESLKQSPRSQLSVDYYATLGRARMETGDRVGAREALDEALGLVEQGLRTAASEPERLAWSRRSEQVYRARVRWELSEDTTRAWEWWDWFPGASLRQRVAGGRRGSGEIRRHAVEGSGALLSYAVFPDGVAAWVADARGVNYRWLRVRQADLERQANRFAARCSDPGSAEEVARQEGREMEQLLIEPLAPLLDGHAALTIEPDRAIDKVPFEALLDSGGRYLGDRYQMSYSPGAYYVAAAGQEERFGPASRLLVAADSGAHPEAGLGGLAEAETEARQVAGLFQNAVLLLGAEANRPAIEAGLRRADLVHFAGHAVNREDSSVLLLAGERMDAATLRQLHFQRARMVVLAACGSAQDDSASFSGQQGLARALLSEGVPQVAASRWAVNSEATRELIGTFYGSLRNGADAAAAMRTAREKLRADTRWRHPFYWAALAIFGRA